jgi:hypothetical protein
MYSPDLSFTIWNIEMIEEQKKPKRLTMTISAKAHTKLKMNAFMEDITQSAFIEKMVAEYVPPDMRPDDIDKQRDEQAFLKRLKAEGWVIEPPKGEASK